MKAQGLSERIWQLSAASVLGKSHVDSGQPNQDAFAVVTDQTGEVVCAVVSDGAGTAPRSAEGSRLAADFIAERLCQVGRRWGAAKPATEVVHDEFAMSIAYVRSQLAGAGPSLRDFHCTLVAWLFTPAGSFIAQIGDSAALSTRFAWVNEAGDQKADFFPDGGWRLHEVERGEYANETHFLTEDDWESHLRITALPPGVDGIVLMTDGAMDIAMLDKQVFRGFLSNLVGKLLSTPASKERDAIIHAWLDDPQTYSVTGDDKTLFVAVRQARSAFASAPVFVAQSRALPSSMAVTRPATATATPRQDTPPAPSILSRADPRETVLPLPQMPARPHWRKSWIWSALGVLCGLLAAGVWFFPRHPINIAENGRVDPISKPRSGGLSVSVIPTVGPFEAGIEPTATGSPAISGATTTSASTAGTLAAPASAPSVRAASAPNAPSSTASRTAAAASRPVAVAPHAKAPRVAAASAPPILERTPPSVTIKEGNAAMRLSLVDLRVAVEIKSIEPVDTLRVLKGINACQVGLILNSSQKSCMIYASPGPGAEPGDLHVIVAFASIEQQLRNVLELRFINPRPKP